VVERAEVELAGRISEAVERLEDSGQAEGVDDHARQGGPPLAVVGDERKLRQVVHNLLGNAVEAAAIRARRPRPSRSTGVAWGAYVEVSIADRGPGVRPTRLPRLFEPFFTTRARGHGLGLAIARSLARAHGGDIDARARAPAAAWSPRDRPCARPEAS
jgi:signal transduction histidine kinase